jgi:hypothetical protein
MRIQGGNKTGCMHKKVQGYASGLDACNYLEIAVMSRFIVVAKSGEVLSTHKSLELAEKSAKKFGGYVVETEGVVKKGDLFELPVIDDVESFEAEQELKECDEADEQKVKLELSSSFKIGDVIETMWKCGAPTGDRYTVYAVDDDLKQVFFDSPRLVTGGYDNCRKFDRVYLVTVESVDFNEDFSDEPLAPEQITLAEKECDEVIAESETLTRATNLTRKITYPSGAWIEINYQSNSFTVSDENNQTLVTLAQMILSQGAT